MATTEAAAGESFAALFEESLARKEMRVGEVITAEVIRIDSNHIVVNAGLKSESYILLEEFQNDRGEIEKCTMPDGVLPDDPTLHACIVTYASDMTLLDTTVLPFGLSWDTPGMQMASLDHAMWFHRPFRVDDWLLYVMESPNASGGRGLALGRFFTRDGHLVASTAQEGVIRVWNGG